MTGGRPWLVTGASGLLGRELCAGLRGRGCRVLTPSSAELDVREPATTTAYLTRHSPGIVVNCAAWTAVDDAERHQEEAYLLNAAAPRYLARACRTAGARLLHLSTDYAFSGLDGGTREPYAEDTPPAAGNTYGRTKLAGERAVLEELPDRGTVVRTSWLYGGHGRNFVTVMRRRAAGTGIVRVADDQHGQPTWTRDVVRALLLLADTAPERTTGCFHATGTGSTTWYGLAREVFRLWGADPGRLEPVTTASLGGAAPRPAWSVLGHDRWSSIGEPPVRPWDEALACFHREESARTCAR